jgi:hypothetical protein
MTTRKVLVTASDVLAAYRKAQIVSREFDEGDDEMEEAWHAAYLAHVAYDPSLNRSGCPECGGTGVSGCGARWHDQHRGGGDK